MNDYNNNGNIIKKTTRFLLIALGFILVGIGILGIFLPVLPTTPFLLLAAALFAKSSPKFYKLLINNKYLGSYLHDYREGKGISLKIKIITLILLWTSILISAFLLISDLYIRISLILIAFISSFLILKIKTKNTN